MISSPGRSACVFPCPRTATCSIGIARRNGTSIRPITSAGRAARPGRSPKLDQRPSRRPVLGPRTSRRWAATTSAARNATSIGPRSITPTARRGRRVRRPPARPRFRRNRSHLDPRQRLVRRHRAYGLGRMDHQLRQRPNSAQRRADHVKTPVEHLSAISRREVSNRRGRRRLSGENSPFSSDCSDNLLRPPWSPECLRPGGSAENSPAIYRWVGEEEKTPLVPEGRPKTWSPDHAFDRPSGT